MPYLIPCTLQCDNFATGPACGNQIVGVATVRAGVLAGVAPGIQPLDWIVEAGVVKCPVCIAQERQLRVPRPTAGGGSVHS